MAKKKKSNKGLRVVLSAFCVLLGLVLVLMVGATVYLDNFLNRISRVDAAEPTLSHEEIDFILAETDPEEDEEFTGEVLQEEDVTMPTVPAEKIEQEDHIVNILLIGQDRRGNKGRARSDAMILCTVNTEKKTLTMTSFLRDLYVKIPQYNGRSYSNNRINVTYAIGGMEMHNECLELNFGVHVDHNIEVDFSGFEQIIDLLGGVEIELTRAEANWMGGVGSGMNLLDGEKALEYARIRKLDSDFGRTNRQRTVLSAILNKVKTMPLTELTKLANNIFPMITTDMTNDQIVKYVLEFAPILSELEVTTQHIPADGHYYFAKISGMSVIVADFKACNDLLKETIG